MKEIQKDAKYLKFRKNLAIGFTVFQVIINAYVLFAENFKDYNKKDIGSQKKETHAVFYFLLALWAFQVIFLFICFIYNKVTFSLMPVALIINVMQSVLQEMKKT